MDLFAVAIAVVLAGLAGVYSFRYRTHPWDIYYPKLAWLRAGMYFCGCYLLSYWSGAMELLVASPIATPTVASLSSVERSTPLMSAPIPLPEGTTEIVPMFSPVSLLCGNCRVQTRALELRLVEHNAQARPARQGQAA